MRALEFSQMAPTKWLPLTWIVLGLFLAYAIAGNVGPAIPIAKTAFFSSVFFLNIALIVLNALAIVYLIESKLIKFSIRALLSLTLISAVFLLVWSPDKLL